MAPSFFQVLLDPSAPHLLLPPDFVCMHLKNKIPNGPIIQSTNGGYCWKLKIKQIGDSYCFTNGWNNVIKDNNLGFGDFLFFQLVHQSTFKMSIFSPDGCKKSLPSKIEDDDEEEKEDGDDDHDVKDDDDDEKDEGNGDDEDDEDPYFITIISNTHKRLLMIGIDGEGTMTLKNVHGKEWVTGLRLDKSYRSTIRYYLSPKWCVFKRENDLSEGDECVFKFIRSEAITTRFCLHAFEEQDPKIQSTNGGYSWTLKIKQIGDSYRFTNGWNNVVNDIPLGFRNFLFFRLVDQSTFKLSIYKPSGCEKIEHDDDDEKNQEISDDDDDPFFTSVITRTHTCFLRLPGLFAELAGIDGEGTMTLKNVDGKEWVTGLKLDKAFRTRSEGKLLLAKVTKKKCPAGEFPVTEVVKRGRRRPGYELGGDVDVGPVEMCLKCMQATMWSAT
ncbi:hypothetical protein L1987_38695 [Smallanthus sonchifolius]|uniref:Uncharacterized protein n=1 Tax=Smallanthus sonchifolius TaxID=185202 RepID=A0ACB9HJP5_9ASTR|nr:hypothetical protein L1987_38695 [Smallanthus sonchifolius]